MGGLLLTTVLGWVWLVTTQEWVADTSLSSFGTSPYYKDYKMITSVDNAFDQRNISKETPLLWARMDCAQSCAKYATCLSFNFYETSADYVCELLPDNYCRNLDSKVLLPWPGNLLFDKLSDGATVSCFEVMFNSTTGFDCKILRPGCLGSWPNCTSCVKHSMEWSTRYGSTGTVKTCTTWPDGDAPSSLPIFGLCYYDSPFLIYRSVNPSTGNVITDYRMSFPNMNRLFNLGAYKQFIFFFQDSYFSLSYSYRNAYIYPNGTLTNMTHYSSTFPVGDTFGLQGKPLAPTPFVTVLNDSKGCGSFWLFTTSDPINCPGGDNGMLGQVKFSGTTVINTGIRCWNLPKAFKTYLMLA